MSRKRSLRDSSLRRLLSFPLLRGKRKRREAPSSEGEVLFELAGINPENLLLGRFRPEEVRERIRNAGIAEGLARKGYHDPVLALACGDPEDQRILLYDGKKSRDRLLMEVRLQIRAFRPGKPIGPFPVETVFRMLLIHWLSLSDPERPFSTHRPRLPGQERPGLGILPECLSFLREIGRNFSLDGLLDVPDHFHTALFYSRKFRFLDPRAEGRFLAMVRDLKGIPLALASEAVQERCLVDSATGLPVSWEAAEQVMPLRDPLRRYLRSPEYRSVRDEVAANLHVNVDWDRYKAKIDTKGGSGKYP
jgi:hypothetical protein